MKKFIPNVLTSEEALEICTDEKTPEWNVRHYLNDLNLMSFDWFSDPLVKVLKVIVEEAKLDGKFIYNFISNKNGSLFFVGPEGRETKGYFRLEKGIPGEYEHKWHVDTGSSGHMKWCNYGTSTLLSHPDTFKGAELEYCESFVPKEKHYLGTGMHSSDVRHRLRCGKESTDGVREGARKTLLFFI